MNRYDKMICRQLNSYRKLRFADNPEVFDRPPGNEASRPPVFLPDLADLNVLIDPKTSQSDQHRLLALVSKRHRWFRSMKSSQALAQSLFGNLIVSGKLDVLSSLRTDDNRRLFGGGDHFDRQVTLEHTIGHNPLKEIAPTEIDLFFSGEHQVAVECKLTETGIGACSIPKRRDDECDGNLHSRPEAVERCYLKGRGIKYWDHIPTLFDWEYESDSYPCPLQSTYQLVRNILAVCIKDNDTIDPDKGHAVLVFDDRNPAFQSGGLGHQAWQTCKDSLKFKQLLQRCSWQTIVGCLSNDSKLRWLTDEIANKYGIR